MGRRGRPCRRVRRPGYSSSKRDRGKGPRRATPGRPWFWVLLPKQKDRVVRGRNPASPCFSFVRHPRPDRGSSVVVSVLCSCTRAISWRYLLSGHAERNACPERSKGTKRSNGSRLLYSPVNVRLCPHKRLIIARPDPIHFPPTTTADIMPSHPTLTQTLIGGTVTHHPLVRVLIDTNFIFLNILYFGNQISR